MTATEAAMHYKPLGYSQELNEQSTESLAHCLWDQFGGKPVTPQLLSEIHQRIRQLGWCGLNVIHFLDCVKVVDDQAFAKYRHLTWPRAGQPINVEQRLAAFKDA